MFNLFKKKTQSTLDNEIEDEVLAVISLLVEAANIDEVFEEREKKIISEIIKKQFSIKDDALINKTLDKIRVDLNESGDLVTHTKKVKNSWSLEKRIQIIEMLWKVCLVDNNLDPYEDMLIRKIAGLIYIEPKDSNAAKARVLKSLDK
ncbi:MAG: hypothetical protein CFH34_00329 [Alphaproteobacteria bacterium MarineAlpha9_Bin4]|nr:hypothetical protein [Pelagibacterales bacterium]PPR27295.1 MAG: hypothetical protein CFH34_00329 [Alphaproteobacteria bacterium MarineAlpha9_Bin4]|tara:strand:+ start:5832 stop:6275 length:444 start_codon:yes stop_codon:yes gene_type:complete